MSEPKKILIIEDEAAISKLYKMAFDNAGFQTEIAGEAAEAYQKLKAFKPDVVFVDMMLPAVSGLDLLKELRANPAYNSQHAKIILLTNLAQDDLKETARQSGADGFIVKANTTPADLVAMVKSLRQNHQNSQGPQLPQQPAQNL